MNKIDETVLLIFKGDFQEVIKNVMEIIESIENGNVFCDVDDNKSWKEITYYLSVGLENKDYLVVADLLKYELRPLLQKLIEVKEIIDDDI